MHYLWQHIKTVVNDYNGSQPLALFLKAYCRRFPKLGSRDRKVLSAASFSWYRCCRGVIMSGTSSRVSDKYFEKILLECLRVCNVPPSAYERLYAGLPLPADNMSFDPDKLFPAEVVLSDGISRERWLGSLTSQPLLFIRVRKDEKDIRSRLHQHGIETQNISSTCLAMTNGTPVDTILAPDNYVVQDASSQATGKYFKPQPGEHWLDCCAGAGGKSLMLMDKDVPVHLTVADVRAGILQNLKERFRLYSLRQPAMMVADMAKPADVAKVGASRRFDTIICDVPCTGSGTWARTPEQCYFFDTDAIAQYSALQLQIAANAVELLKPGGSLIYITCSVFRQENENVVEELLRSCRLEYQEGGLINGIPLHADSLFVAVLRRPH